MKKLLTGLFVVCMLSASIVAAQNTAENAEDDAWLDDDSEWRALQVNEGQLTFIDAQQATSVLHSDTQLWLTEASIQTGWVKMQQCYRQLDSVGRTDVVYAYAEMRNLEIIQAEKISQARVMHNRIELEDVEKAASLCVKSEVRVLNCLESNVCSIKNGPYHRKFLDGYYPYHVTLTVHYPGSSLKLERIHPDRQKGVDVIKHPGRVKLDYWFEGELMIDLEFINSRKAR